MTSSISQTVKENLNKWEDLSPLNEEQVKSILLLSQLNQFQANEFDDNEDDENADDRKAEAVDARSGADKAGAHSDEHSESKRKNSILHEDINELLYNFDINDIEDPKIEKYYNNLLKNSKKCAQMSDSIQTAFKHLNVLLDNYSQVSQKTRSLHVACEQLLSDQNKLVNASYMLSSRLSYFTDMEVFMQVIFYNYLSSFF